AKGGIGYRRAHRAALLGPEAGPEILEIVPEHFFGAPDQLDALAERYPLVFHSVGLSVGTAVDDPVGDAMTRAYLERIRALARRARPLYVSDHLAFTRSPSGTDLGHLCPLPLTEESYALVAARVRRWQDALELPLALENIAHPFVWPGDTVDEPTFFRRLADDTGCGLLLDVTNLLYDARNFGQDPRALLERYPLHAVRGLHLAGGARARDQFWIDSHDRPVDEDAFALLPALRGRAPIQAAIVERDARLPSVEALCAEARRAASLLRDA
ncbi:MAG TPA: DUF692 domain-containing protein, partial [Polyangia bacterium]|nr:DUF692 domain-containing protein [Polyangia bacterium]